MSVLFLKSASLLALSVRYASDLWRQTTPLRNHKYRRVCLASWWLQIVLSVPRARHLLTSTSVYLCFLTVINNLLSSFCVRSLCAAVNIYCLACSCCPLNCSYVLFSNKIAFLMDLLLHQLTVSPCMPSTWHSKTSFAIAKHFTYNPMRIQILIFQCV